MAVARCFNWQMNGPGYILSTWDTVGQRMISMASFTDGASNTAVFSEWVKGPAHGSPDTNGLGMVYQPSGWSGIELPSRPISSSRSPAHRFRPSTRIKRAKLEGRVVDVGCEPDLLAYELAQSLLL